MNWFNLVRGVEQERKKKQLQKQQQEEQKQLKPGHLSQQGSMCANADLSIPVDCVFLEHSSLGECISRCQSRTGHETVPPSRARSVVGIVAKQFRVPTNDKSKRMQYRSLRTIPINDTSIFHDVLLECLNTM